MNKKALLIGNSDGIGLATTRELLKRGWKVTGTSKSKSPIKDPAYKHTVMDVLDDKYPIKLKSILKKDGPFELCIFCVGIGELLDLSKMESETKIFNVNLIAMIKTVSYVIPFMIKRGEGHFIGISSLADELLSPKAPSYHASKAGFSNYLEGLALALKPEGVHISNIRFGFVNTKMAKGGKMPFMMDVEKAARHLLSCIKKKPVRYTAPWIMIPLLKLHNRLLRFQNYFSRIKSRNNKF